jgi:hypothetical protein
MPGHALRIVERLFSTGVPALVHRLLLPMDATEVGSTRVSKIPFRK